MQVTTRQGSSGVPAALVLGALVAIASGASASDDFDWLVNARFIHCAFFNNGAEAGLGRLDEHRADLLVHYGAMNRDRTRARVVSTRAAGAREVRVYRTARAVHFVDETAGAFRVTTVTGCSQRQAHGGTSRCVTFSAVNSWHFDAAVTSDPDRVFDRIKHMGSYGFCDHSFSARE